VGALLATRLFVGDHEVSVIDQDDSAFDRLGRGFGGQTLRGKAFDRDTLVRAGIEHADAFIAVTSGDNSNIVSAMVAKEAYRVPHVVSRIYDPRRAEIYRRLGIPAISSVSWSAHEILSLVVYPRLATRTTFGDGEVRLLATEVPPRLAGRPINDIEREGEISVVSVLRTGHSFLPVSGAQFAQGDILFVAVSASAMDHFERMLEP
jgi:trk system potassium uptake protein TrkA